ncbi:hypothetical protein I4F81_004544 [Pyropia yezoensis]|uniref:Uncharacterized protein n=1 Tax=Pyropia yezoensis TaxID=2788 RepID=A0ACC3BVP7_PYRYE|nr:hypothetical protein I4F81_004544 [Neopyropia yezoensis]
MSRDVDDPALPCPPPSPFVWTAAATGPALSPQPTRAARRAQQGDCRPCSFPLPSYIAGLPPCLPVCRVRFRLPRWHDVAACPASWVSRPPAAPGRRQLGRPVARYREQEGRGRQKKRGRGGGGGDRVKMAAAHTADDVGLACAVPTSFSFSFCIVPPDVPQPPGARGGRGGDDGLPPAVDLLPPTPSRATHPVATNKRTTRNARHPPPPCSSASLCRPVLLSRASSACYGRPRETTSPGSPPPPPPLQHSCSGVSLHGHEGHQGIPQLLARFERFLCLPSYFLCAPLLCLPPPPPPPSPPLRHPSAELPTATATDSGRARYPRRRPHKAPPPRGRPGSRAVWLAYRHAQRPPAGGHARGTRGPHSFWLDIRDGASNSSMWSAPSIEGSSANRQAANGASVPVRAPWCAGGAGGGAAVRGAGEGEREGRRTREATCGRPQEERVCRGGGGGGGVA